MEAAAQKVVKCLNYSGKPANQYAGGVNLAGQQADEQSTTRMRPRYSAIPAFCAFASKQLT
jgi:hypothetical protein